MIVVDASVLAVALVDEGSHGALARRRLTGERLAAPHLIDIELASVWRGLVLGGRLGEERARAAFDDLSDLPLERARHQGLLARCWELRHNLTIYDASYVALAEALDCVLVTADLRLKKAAGPRCEIEVLEIGG